MTRHNQRVLVVEDHRALQRMLRTLFESAGFVVDTAADGYRQDALSPDLRAVLPALPNGATISENALAPKG